jgi:hypothetical protein
MSVRSLALLLCVTPVTALAESPAPSTSPAANVVFAVTGSSNAAGHRHWGRLVDEWRVQMASAAKEAGYSISYQEGHARPIGTPGFLVAIYVRHFRYVTPGTRGVAGQWAGQAELNVDVAFRDLNTGRPLTDRPIRASSEWSQARFGDATNHQVRDASQEIMTEVRTLLANPPSEAKAESPPAAAVSAPPPTAPTNADAGEIAFWKSVRDSRNPAELRAYLDQFPNGVFAPIARERLARLETRSLPPSR